MKFHQSIQFKCVFFITTTIFIIGLGSTLTAYHFNKIRLKENYIEKNLSVMDVGSNYMDAKFQSIYDTILDIYSEQTLYNLMKQDQFTYSEHNYMQKLLRAYCSADPDIQQMYLWCPNMKKSFLATDNTMISLDTQSINPQLEIYHDTQLHTLPVKMSNYYDYDSIIKIKNDLMPINEPVITFAAAIYPIHTSGTDNPLLGSLAIDLKAKAITDIASFLFDAESEDFYLLDENNHILLSQTVDTPLEPDSLLKNFNSDSEVQEQSNGTIVFRKQLIIGGKLLQVVKVIYLQTLYTTARQSFYASAVSLLLSWALVLAVILFIVNLVTNRIACLCQYAERIKEGDTEASIRDYPNLVKKDEIGILSQALEGSIQSINQLTKQKYQLLLSNKDIQIKMLQAQINPHFINNALQAIGNAIFEKEPMYVYHLISNLGKMMKYSMHTDHNVIFLEDELDYLRQFLIFQQERIGPKFHFSIETEPESLFCQIPKMLIQPMVENSVMHGFTGQKENFYLAIHTALDGDYLTIQVTDNGIGTSAEQLAILNHPGADSKSIGIRNTYERLAFFYSNDFSLYFEAGNPHGFVSTIRIPRNIPES